MTNLAIEPRGKYIYSISQGIENILLLLYYLFYFWAFKLIFILQAQMVFSKLIEKHLNSSSLY